MALAVTPANRYTGKISRTVRDIGMKAEDPKQPVARCDR